MFEKRSSSFWQAAKALIIFCHAVVFLLTAASWSSAGKKEAYEHLTAVMDQQQSSSELRFLKSYVTLAVTSPDRYLQNVAFIYDNALALLAFLARGSEDDPRRAKVLADAFVYAMGHDRSYGDHRLRNAYNSDDLIDDATGAAKLPGWWDANAKQWVEDEVQVSSHTGNLAWVTAVGAKTGGVSGLAGYTEAGLIFYTQDLLNWLWLPGKL
jgi:hypothetical protein